MQGGQWTVNGSVEDFRALQVRLKEAPKIHRKNMKHAIVVATAPARKAVKAELEQIMPKGGGLNEYLAKSQVQVSVLTGANSAGVVIRGRTKAGRRDKGQFRLINQGQIRHPVFADKDKAPKEWHWVTQTGLPEGWWERTLGAFDPAVKAGLVEAMNVTARETGFTH